MIELYANGLSFQEIHKQIDVSVGYISSVKERCEENLGKGELEAIHEFTKMIRKLDISPQQLLIGAKTFSLLQQNNLKSEELELFLKKVSKIIEEKDYDLATIIGAYEKVLILESKSKVSLEHLPAEYESLANKVIILQKEVSELASAKEKAETELKNLLKNAKRTSENIQQFISIRNELQKNDIDCSNLTKLCTLIKRSEDANYDFQKIRKHIEKEVNYESRIAQLEDKTRTLEAREANLQAKNEEISGKISKNEEQLLQTEQLKKLGVLTVDFIQFSKKIVEISKTHDISLRNAFGTFVKNLATYDALKGFQKELEKIKNEIEKKSVQLESIQVKIENFNIKNKENYQTLKIIKTLKQKGIEPFLILTWHKIFETSNLNPKTFEEKLLKLANVSKLISAEQYDLAQLTKEKKKLESTIDFLKINREKLESTIKYGNELIKKSLTENVQESVNQIRKTTTMGSNSIKNMQDTAIASIDKISQETFDQMKESFEKTQSLVNMAMESSEKIGQLEFFIPLYKLANGTFVVSELYPTMIALLDKFSLESQRRGTSSSWMISRIQSLREEMIKELTKTG